MTQTAKPNSTPDFRKQDRKATTGDKRSCVPILWNSLP